MTLKVDEIQNTSGGAVTLTKQEACKARWFYDQTNVEIDGSFNVTSITDSATGRYKPNLTSALSGSTGASMVGTTGRTGIPKFSGISGKVQVSASQFDCNTENESNNASDTESGGVVHGDLA